MFLTKVANGRKKHQRRALCVGVDAAGGRQANIRPLGDVDDRQLDAIRQRCLAETFANGRHFVF